MKEVTKNVLLKAIENNQMVLKSRHKKLCLPIINRIYKKMLIGIKFKEIKVANGLIIEGHHRYIASLLANFDLIQIPSNISSATTITNWNLVEFVEDDWDTEAKINMLNEHDANYNNLAINELIEILK